MREILNIVISLSTLVSIVALVILWAIAMYEVVKRKDLKKSRLLWIALLLLFIPFGLIMDQYLEILAWFVSILLLMPIALIMYFFTEKRKKQGYIARLFFFIIIASFIVFSVLNIFFSTLGFAI
ncbi:MAG: hypothetical protein HOL80_04430 [Candidatus Magasanikbacteria bacterium]|jgi:hypothetical protein|nr:hypothetical protein [Candidatus Magasanikbacteria bacterium]MBT5263109.1 hypothetical protein [Candidatus Magasanikbacteria bacterium]MBT5820112.1 hypothetical protein [Candidatus Magasanikbacteria bacterium]MBT6294571.1 hypothetical protein [Candidatus Magasanikbacteria bacterium]